MPPPAPEKKFGGKTTADEVIAGRDLRKLYVVVTGANTGIGFETARAFSAGGAHVTMACRSEESGQKAAANVRNVTENSNVEFARLDLADSKSIKHFANTLAFEQIDILICNAGLVANNYQTTSDGLEMTVGVCHYGHFLLTKLLMKRLLACTAPRVVLVSSESHRSPRTLDFEHFPAPEKNFRFMRAYGQAKLANVLMANELQRRYSKQGLTACSLHPGTLITTEIGRNSRVIAFLMKLISPFTKTPNQGASTTMVCALQDADSVASQYYSNCQPTTMSEEAMNPEVASRLWDLSEQWCDSLV